MRGTVRDIRTGRAVRKTNDLSTAFIDHITAITQEGMTCYVVTGNCRHRDMRWAITRMREAGITVIRDGQFPPDTFWLFEGEPDELGFAV